LSLKQNALLLVLLAALIAVVGDWSGDATLERWWRAPIGLLLLGLAYEAAVTRRARPLLTVLAPTRWLLSRPTSLQLALQCPLARALTVELAVSGPADVALPREVGTLQLPPTSQAVLALSATARRLGTFDWPPLSARLSGVLGLAWWGMRLEPAFRLQVIPDLLSERQRALDATAGGARAAARAGAGGEILQLREYRAGDAPRAIDWKATARAGRLVARDFSEDQHLEIIIALDVSRTSGLAAADSDRLALYVNIASRLAQRAAQLDDRVGLLLYADTPLAALSPARGEPAVRRVRTLLGEAQVRLTESNPVLAAARIRSLTRQRSMVLMLTDLDDAAMAQPLLGAARLLAPKHLPFIASVSSDLAQSLAWRAAREDHEVFESIAAQRYCSGLSRNVNALRTAGAACVLAPAATLDRAVLDAYLEFRRRRRV
jgi:uncharacterized protein (DUF58 family)